jgi:hypothetical protein
VLSDSTERERDELAPGERQAKPTDKDLYARLQRYMRTRDDEDLAIEQLPTPTVGLETGLEHAVAAEESHEGSADRSEPAVRAPAIHETVRAAPERVSVLQAQLEALASTEVRRLEAVERRERELLAHQDELQLRAREIPPPPRLPLALDRFARERENLQHALDGIDAELHGVRTLRARLIAEVGQPDQIRAERRALETVVAGARTERDALISELVAQELATPARWAIAALGERPSPPRERQLWDRAARGLARYRIEHDIIDDRVPLGERPTDHVLAEHYERALARLERVRHELGVDAPAREHTQPPRLPPDYARLFGEPRAASLEEALAAEYEQMRALSDEQLRTLAATPAGQIDELDRRAAVQAIRLEDEHAHHQHTAAKQADRAARLQEQAEELGWRNRHDRGQLRHDTDLHRQHAARHIADAERIELELRRLRAAGRHPEQWLQNHGQQLVKQIAASAELAERRELQIERAAELAMNRPPAHVQELIGERPVSSVRHAQEWEHLAQRIERHRLTYQLDIERQGPLGPEAATLAREQRGAYDEQRLELAAQVAIYREARNLPAHEQVRELTRDREHSLERDI